jgi:hypothetical protein
MCFVKIYNFFAQTQTQPFWDVCAGKTLNNIIKLSIMTFGKITLSIMTFGIKTLSVMTFGVTTLSILTMKHNDT